MRRIPLILAVLAWLGAVDALALPCCTLAPGGTIQQPAGCSVCAGTLLPPATTSSTAPTTSTSSSTTSTRLPTTTTSSSTTSTSSSPSTSTPPTTIITAATWAQALGEASSDGIYGVGVRDVDGAVAVAGSVKHPSALNPSAAIALYDASGSRRWLRIVDATSVAMLDALAVDPAGDLVVSGRFGGTIDLGCGPVVASGPMDALVAKVRATDGGCLWARGYGGAYDDAGSAVAVDPAGNVYAGGYFRGTMTIGGTTLSTPYGSDLDAVVVKYSPTGTPLWAKSWQDTGTGRAYGLAADASGIAITGAFSNVIDFGGGPLVAANAMTDVFVAKLTPAGVHVWSKRFGAATSNEGGYGVALDTASNVVVTGYCYNPLDFGGGFLLGQALDAFVVKLAGNDGGHIWSQRIGGAGSDYGYGVAVDGGGNVSVVGTMAGTVDFGGVTRTAAGASDAYVARYTAGLGLLDVTLLGGAQDDFGRAVALTATGAPVFAGYFTGAAMVRGLALTAAGGADGFVVRTD